MRIQHRFIAHTFLSNKHKQSCLKSPHQYGATLNKRQFCGQKEKTNQMDVSAYPWTCQEKKLLIRAFSLNIRFFSFENCHLAGKKQGQTKVGDNSKILRLGKQKPSVQVQSKTQTNLVTWLLQALFSEFRWKEYDCSMSPCFSMSPHLTVSVKVLNCCVVMAFILGALVPQFPVDWIPSWKFCPHHQLHLSEFFLEGGSPHFTWNN